MSSMMNMAEPSAEQRRTIGAFASYSYMHGLSDIRRNLSHAPWLAFYTLVTVVMAILCSVNISMGLIDFFARPTNTNFKVSHESEAPFPGVTFCNLQAARRSTLPPLLLMNIDRAIYEMSLFYKTWPQLLGKEIFVREDRNDLFQSFSVPAFYADLILAAYYDLQIELDAAGHQLEDMLADCEFQKVQCTPANFTKWTSPVYGNCYTFVTTAPSLIGPDDGLKLVLYTNAEEYTSLQFTAGFRFVVHPPETMPFPADNGMNVSPGLATSFGVKKTSIDRQPLPYDNQDCGTSQSEHAVTNIFQAWETFVIKQLIEQVEYTQKACEKTCKALLILSRCDCVDTTVLTTEMTKKHSFFRELPEGKQSFSDLYLMPLPFRKACATSERVCTKNVSTLVSTGVCGPICPPACRENIYNVMATSSSWPRDTVLSTQLPGWVKRVPLMNNTVKDKQSAMQNVAKVDVYLQDLNVQNIVEEPKYDFWSFMSTLGGTLGLWTGLSILGLLQFIELVVLVFSQCCSNSKKQHSVEPLRPAQIYPVVEPDVITRPATVPSKANVTHPSRDSDPEQFISSGNPKSTGQKKIEETASVKHTDETSGEKTENASADSDHEEPVPYGNPKKADPKTIEELASRKHTEEKSDSKTKRPRPDTGRTKPVPSGKPKESNPKTVEETASVEDADATSDQKTKSPTPDTGYKEPVPSGNSGKSDQKTIADEEEFTSASEEEESGSDTDDTTNNDMWAQMYKDLDEAANVPDLAS